jgi:arabinan endo-1,5-alpha-L-arabinosidase
MKHVVAFAVVLASAALTMISCRLAPSAEPVLDHDFPDPVVLRADDGAYYAYATQGYSEEGDELLNIQLARSKDLSSWEHLGDAMPAKPAWAKTTQKFWAPHVSKVGALYVMYFSGEPDAQTAGLCLGVATSASPTGPFKPEASPLLCGHSFENIDPMLFRDPVSGKNLLYWGSGFKPIRVREMTADGLHFAPGSSATAVLSPVTTIDPHDYLRLVEGAWVEYRAPYYYLFVSGDNCCNPNPHYAVVAARSTSATGPFELIGTVLESYDRFLATGHNSVIEDANGVTWTFFHAIDTSRPTLTRQIPGDRDVRRVLMRARVDWDVSGPVVIH